MQYREVTLDDLIAEVKQKEAVTRESDTTKEMIEKVSNVIKNLGDTVRILTDYDADGICSAYIMEKTIKALSPNKDVKVICNDRRGSYGVPRDLPHENADYVILDTGSNELPYIREHYGNAVILDHHLIETEDAKQEFRTKDRLLNLQCLDEPAQYCATGLAYRVYQTLQKDMPRDEKRDNTMAIMACIGTATDMVNVLDTHSYNREILKNGIECINNADEDNTEFVIGYMLEQCGIGTGLTTAHQIAFNVGAFINSASRMSEIINENGAQTMYDALSGNYCAKTFTSFERLLKLNEDRKAYVSKMQDEDYKKLINEQRFESDDKIVIDCYFNMDGEKMPHPFCGLIASKITDAADKSAIVLTYNEETDSWSGSGRNLKGMSSLKKFMDVIAQSPEMQGVTFKYGGHNDAIGISRLDDIGAFKTAIQNHQDEFKKLETEKLVLKISPSENVLEKIKELEPMGIGLVLPPVMVEGELDSIKPISSKTDRSDWKRYIVKSKDLASKITVTDWNANAKEFPFVDMQTQSGEIKALCDIGVSNFGSPHIEYTVRFNGDLYKEQSQAKAITQSAEIATSMKLRERIFDS